MQGQRPLAVWTVVTLLAAGCSSWQVVDHRSRPDVESAMLEGERVRITTGERREIIQVSFSSFPVLHGERVGAREATEGRFVTIRLGEVDRLEVWSASFGATFEAAHALYGLVGVIAVLAFLAGA